MTPESKSDHVRIAGVCGTEIPDLSVAINKMAELAGMPSFGVLYPLEFGKPYTLAETCCATHEAVQKLTARIEAILTHLYNRPVPVEPPIISSGFALGRAIVDGGK